LAARPVARPMVRSFNFMPSFCPKAVKSCQRRVKGL
jgi:hypothetical protein